MKLQLLVATAVAVVACTQLANGQKIDKFGADMGKKSAMGKEIRVPYTDLISYYGYVKPGAAPDETREGKKYYYLYVWIPAVAPELGVRMVSPVPDKMAPEATDFVGADFKANETDKTNYFDTWITLERADGVTKAEDIVAKGKGATWNKYDSNDDSSELPAQPSGSKYNSLMRITSETSNPTKSLVVGLYRIGFTTYKTGEVQGSFVAQVGSPVKLPGVQIAQNMESLMKAVTGK
ncbi:MAG: Lipl32 family lipoprotein [Bacteroidetes bacterium]|nr:Lipl32 family lipoprotein [Bacteroidota bacterium]